MLIGEVSRRAGLSTSTLRYYEHLGLLPRATRKSGRRRYTREIFDHLKVIEFARHTGFPLTEIESLFLDGKSCSMRLQRLARAKLEQTEAMIQRAETMRQLLRPAVRYRCADIGACSRRLLAVS